MKTKKLIYIFIFLVGSVQVSTAQSLLDILDSEQKDTIGYVPPTFKMSRIALGHSTEVRSKGVLEVFAANRFWNLPTERSQTFAADKMASRFALEYGLSNRFSVGVGASTFDRLFDGFLKYQLLSQKKGEHPSRFNITLLQAASYNSASIPNPTIQDDFSDRLSFTSQLLFSRRITSEFSLQVSPTYIHRGLVLSDQDPQDYFALGFGARYRIGSHVSVVSEYYKTFNTVESFDSYGPFALGVNWEIGDVLLQFMLTNAVNFAEDRFITQTRNNFNFKNPNLNFGFNATYVIHFRNKLKRD